MLEKLEAIKQRWQELGDQLADPAVQADHRQLSQLNKHYKELQILVDAYEPYRKVMTYIEENREILKNDRDPEFRELAKAELDELLAAQEQMEEHIRELLIPKDPKDFEMPSSKFGPARAATRRHLCRRFVSDV